MTAPTKPPTTVHGYVSDNLLFGDILSEANEYIGDLVWPLSVDTYNMMRRDARLSAIIDGYTLQLTRAQWQLDGAGCRPEVVQLVADDLGLPVAGNDAPGPARTKGVSWGEHLRAALTMLPFGHAAFELDVDLSSSQARLVGLYERPQWTISHMHIDGKTGALNGITQDAAWKEKAPQIRSNALCFYSHRREGAGWQGVSLLRPAYAPWILKREMMRVAAISHRRWGAGVPIAEAIPGTNPTPAQMAEAQRMASAARAGDQAGAAMPPNFTLKIAGLSGSVPDTLAFLEWLNREMAQATLMQHIDLGQGGNGGSRALGTAFIDSWTLALGSIGDFAADVATRQVAAKLVEWNFGDEPVPRVVVSGIGSRREVTAESLNLLLGSGALSGDPALEAWVRREYRLPERDPNTPARTATRGAPGQDREPDGRVAEGEPADVQAAAPPDSPVDPTELQADYEQAVEDATQAWEAASGPLVAALAAATAAEVASGMLVGLGALSVGQQVVDELADAVAAVMRGLADRTVGRVAPRLGVTPEVGAAQLERIGQTAQATVDLIVSGYTSGAARVALGLAGPDTPPDAVEQAVTEHLVEVSQAKTSGLVAGNLRPALTTAQGEGLWSAYEQLPAGTRYRVSEVNDRNRCRPCGDNNNRTYPNLAAARADYPSMRYRRCEGRERCRGYVYPLLGAST